MKFVLLCLDGLEYNMAVGGKHSNLMQTCFSKLKVPISPDIGVPLSPTVWGSFLTGKEKRIEFKLSRMQKLSAFGKKLFPFVPLGLHKRFARPAEFPELKQRTLLDEIPCSFALNFPFINYNSSVLEHIIDFYRGKISLDEAIDVSRDTFKQETGTLLESIKVCLKSSPALLLVYIHFPDIIHHLAYMREDVITAHYTALDGFVSDVKGLLDEDVVFLIISDHGFDFGTGQHSLYGFISSDRKMPLPQSIIDLHHMIRSEVKQNA